MIHGNHGNRAEGKISEISLHFVPLHFFLNLKRYHHSLKIYHKVAVLSHKRLPFRGACVYIGGCPCGVIADLRRYPRLSNCVYGCFICACGDS